MNYLLGEEDLRKIGKGLLLALVGATITYLLQVVGKMDFGAYTPYVAGLFGVLANALLKVLDGKVQ